MDWWTGPTEPSGVREVLIIDDDVALATSLADVMTMAGYSVTTVHEGADALLKLFNGKRYDLVLCDILLPDGNGIALAHQLRELPGKPPIFAITEHMVSEEKARAVGFDGLIRKSSMDIGKLVAMADQITGRWAPA